MKRMRILGLALVAVFALAAVTAGAASAVKPTWKVCVKTAKNEEKKYTAEYTDKLCSVKSETKEGKYELVAGIGKGKPFKGKGGLATLHNVIPGKGDITVQCQQFKDSGEVVAPSGVVNVKRGIQEVQIAWLPVQNRRRQKGNHHDRRGLAGVTRLAGQRSHARW